jgi:glycosyltransferase involved in cell wall biosynthesis
LLTKKLPVVGALVGEYYLALERRQTRNSDANLVISEDFSSILLGWGAARAQMHVIPNWGAIDQIAVQPKDNAWARAHGVADKKVILYSGTIGLKHDPMKLVALAEEFRADPSVVIVVVAAGTGVAALQTAKQERNLDNLMLLGLQAFKDLPEVMGAADVLAAMIEPDAGQFSVPSKVNSYLCARRPILLASPQENLAARIVSTSGAGLTVDSRDNAGWIAAAKALMGDADLRKKLADSGRAYAEDNFDIGRVTDRFEAVIASAMGGGQAPPAQTHAPNAPLERNQTYA